MKTRQFLMLFVILTALGLTSMFVSADGQPGPTDDALDTLALGESLSPAANLTESEPNNGFGSADLMQLGDVVSGSIRNGADLDYYRIDVPLGAIALMEIDTQGLSSALDARICLYDKQLIERQCSDNSNGLDPILWERLNGENWWPGTPYYVRVQDSNYPNEGGASYKYKLLIYRPVLISAATGGTVAGVPFAKSDVLANYRFWDGTEKWSLFFDASDVGITQNVTGLAAPYYNNEIGISLQATQTVVVDGVNQPVTPFDVLRFEPGDYGQYGPNTSGVLTFYQTGSYAGMGPTASEKIDALAEMFVTSTTGAVVYQSGLTARDEDLGRHWQPFLDFDGSLVPGLAGEDVFAADMEWGVAYYLTLLGAGRIDAYSFSQKDIFKVDATTHHVVGPVPYWHGPDHGFNYNLDAFDVVD